MSNNNYNINDIKRAFYQSLNFLPMGLEELWNSFVSKLPDKVKRYKCPECGLNTNGHSAHGPESNKCYMVKSRRGGWRELGVYDG